MKKLLILSAFLFFINSFLFAQIDWKHEIIIEAASPTQIYDYPDKSLIFRLGYQPRFNVGKLSLGSSISPEFNRFKILDNLVLKGSSNEIIIKSFGVRVGGFLGWQFSNYFSFDSYFEYGEYTSNIMTFEDGEKGAPHVSAIHSYSLGVKLKYKWQNRWQTYLKIGYEKYQNSSETIWQTDSNFGVFILSALQVKQTFINGIIPSFGIQYTL